MVEENKYFAEIGGPGWVNQVRAWECLPNLRWRQVPSLFPDAPVLEQAWREMKTGEIVWREVETVYE